MSNSFQPHGLHHARPPCPSPPPGVCPSLYPLHQWCHPAISSSDAFFSFCSQSSPASGTFLVSWLFASGDQNTGASASASVLPIRVQGWFPLRLTSLISSLSKGLSGVFSSTTFRRHQLSGALSMGSHRVGHNWSDLAAAAAVFFTVQLSPPYWKVAVESCEDTGILGPCKRRIQCGARDEAWSLRAFV